MKLKLLIFFLLLSGLSYGQDIISTDNGDTSLSDTKIKVDSVDHSKFKKHVRVSVIGIHSKVSSSMRLEGERGILSAQINFENHLGLEDTKNIYAVSVVTRLTPHSGLYGSFYSLNRKNTIILEEDLPIGSDTLKKDMLIDGYFNTTVFSFGYLHSILKDDKAFFGAYLNLYVIQLKAGLRSEIFDFNKSIVLFAPLPNFGVLAAFQLNRSFSIAGSLGIFFVDNKDMTGTFIDANFGVSYNPLSWVGISAGYYIFDVRVGWPVEGVVGYANYNYGGPSLGVTFQF